ncbi:MAG TPA: hypothetical protein VHB21_15995, partial [Minicystis sp.]|nr:hypothetical protein [Minicystis sp.]
YTMVDPEISITPVVSGGPGDTCASADDVTGATFPVQLTGQFDQDPAVGGSCDTTPNNAVWFAYSPASTGPYQIHATNHTTTNAYARLAVFDGTSCSPLGAEVSCTTNSATDVSTTDTLEQGKTYLILFHTDGDTYTMVDPEISIGPPPAGSVCDNAVDVTGASFPVQLTGEFDDDPAVGGSCDTTPNNAVWFSFIPATTASYTISVANATTTFAYSRLAVFDGAGCSPLGTEVTCVTNSAKTASAQVSLTAGHPYRILFHTDGDSYTMVDPQITITSP